MKMNKKLGQMTRTIAIISGKGGVGKTFLTSNLAYSLTELGKDVVVMDANLTTPHLGLHLGMHLVPKTLHDVLRGKTEIKNVTYPHPYGFKVIPASLSANDLVGIDIDKLNKITSSFSTNTDFVILDSAPGLGKEAVSAMQAADETLLITNPDLPSVVDALKVLKIAQNSKKKILGVVLNRVKGTVHELKTEEIEKMLGTPILSEIPEDSNVSISIAVKSPIVNSYSNSPASIGIKKLAYSLCGKQFEYKKSSGFFNRLVNWLIK